MTTGKQLRSLRTKKQVSQKLLAQCGSWSSAYVHKLEQSRSVSVSQVTRYAVALEQASARVTEIRAKEERASQAVLSRFDTPTSKPAPRPVQAPAPTAPPVLPAPVPSRPIPPTGVPTPPPVSPTPSIMKLPEKAGPPLEEPYSASYTRCYERMWRRFQGKVVVEGGTATFSARDALGVVLQAVVMTRTSWQKLDREGRVTESGTDFDRL